MTESKGFVRGSADGPLTIKGRSEAATLGAKFAKKGGLTCLYLSTAKRAQETAKYIIAANPATELETPSADILSWSMGELEGKPSTEAQPRMASFIKYLPDVKVPGKSPLSGKSGESFDDFRWRALPYIGQQMAEWNRNKKLKLGVLTHHRVVRLLIAWIKGGMSPFMAVDCDEMGREYEAGHPGSVYCFAPGDGKLWTLKQVALTGSDPLPPAVYIIRHCSTALNGSVSSGDNAATPTAS